MFPDVCCNRPLLMKAPATATFDFVSFHPHSQTTTAVHCAPSPADQRREVYIPPAAPTMSSRARPPWLKKMKRIIARWLHSGSLSTEAVRQLCDEVVPSIRTHSPTSAILVAAGHATPLEGQAPPVLGLECFIGVCYRLGDLDPELLLLRCRLLDPRLRRIWPNHQDKIEVKCHHLHALAQDPRC